MTRRELPPGLPPAVRLTRLVSPDHDPVEPGTPSPGRALSLGEGVPSPAPDTPQGHPRDDKQVQEVSAPGLAPPLAGRGHCPQELVEQACCREHDPGVERGKTAKQ